jgi:ribosome-associated translation inhibitor RaiA
METSASTEFVVREQLEKLERHCPSLISCRVVIAAPNGRHTQGEHFHVTVDVTLPGAEIVADRDPAQRHSHEDCHAAVRDAFRAAIKEVDKMHSKDIARRRDAR